MSAPHGELVVLVGDAHVGQRAGGIPDKFRALLQPDKMQILVSTGNLCSMETTAYFKTIAPKMYAVRGDMDDLTSGEEEVVFQVGEFRIGVIHGHQIVPWGDAEALAATARRMNCQILVSGHTHFGSVVQQPGSETWFINPGSITGAYTPLRVGVTPSFCLLSIAQNQVKVYQYELNLRTGEVEIKRSRFAKSSLANPFMGFPTSSALEESVVLSPPRAAPASAVVVKPVAKVEQREVRKEVEEHVAVVEEKQVEEPVNAQAAVLLPVEQESGAVEQKPVQEEQATAHVEEEEQETVHAREEVQEPVHEEEEEPAHVEVQEAAHEEEEEPMHEEEQEPAHEEVQEPAHEEVQEPAHVEVQEPAHVEVQEAVHEELQEPVYGEEQEPMQVEDEEQEPEQVEDESNMQGNVVQEEEEDEQSLFEQPFGHQATPAAAPPSPPPSLAIHPDKHSPTVSLKRGANGEEEGAAIEADLALLPPKQKRAPPPRPPPPPAQINKQNEEEEVWDDI